MSEMTAESARIVLERVGPPPNERTARAFLDELREKAQFEAVTLLGECVLSVRAAELVRQYQTELREQETRLVSLQDEKTATLAELQAVKSRQGELIGSEPRDPSDQHELLDRRLRLQKNTGSIHALNETLRTLNREINHAAAVVARNDQLVTILREVSRPPTPERLAPLSALGELTCNCERS